MAQIFYILKDFIQKIFGSIKSKDLIKTAEQSIVTDKLNDDKELKDNSELSVPIVFGASKYAQFSVCLDAGHAKSTPGKRSPYLISKIDPPIPFEEWKFNREIVSKIEAKLKAAGVDVFIVTPEIDNDIALSERAARANNYVANKKTKGIFISIHADASGDGYTWMLANGWSAYTTTSTNNSDILASYLYKAAEEVLQKFPNMKIRRSSPNKPDYERNFTVIKRANMPAVLTENFFYDNISDVSFLNTDTGKNAIAEIHYKGILKFIDEFYLNK